ncbi:MAG: hypothetical protein H7334_14375 [Ferruginibacter sp.]|nr:hypothetical protein [Ferruginibacter sp.]
MHSYENKLADFDETATITVFGAIIIEGLYCFFNDPNYSDAKQIFFKNLHEFTNEHTVVSINVCHMQQNQFCNHAHFILFFSHYNSNSDNSFVQPIICTHAGTTGLSIGNRVKYLLNPPLDKGLVY